MTTVDSYVRFKLVVLHYAMETNHSVIARRTITITPAPITPIPDVVSFVFRHSGKIEPQFEEVFTQNLMRRKDFIADKMVSARFIIFEIPCTY